MVRRTIILLSLWAVSQSALSGDGKKDKVVPLKDKVQNSLLLHQIRAVNPTLELMDAIRVASSIAKACDLFAFKCETFSALLGVESHYVLGSVNRASNDYGIGQINKWHIHRQQLNKQRLLTDLDYSVYWAAIVFHWFWINYPEHEAVGRYNCGTKPSCTGWKSVKRYVKKVLMYKSYYGTMSHSLTRGGKHGPFKRVDSYTENSCSPDRIMSSAR